MNIGNRIHGHNSGSRHHVGFTLVEMLMVMAVMASILAMGGLGVGRALRSMTLTNAGNKVTRLIEAARQQAITKNTLNAVVLMKSLGTEVDARAFTVLEYTVAGGWRQIREWEVLPDGIVVDVGATGTDASFFSNGPQPFPFADASRPGAPVAYGSNSSLPAGTYAARIFLPGGGLLNPDDAAQFRLVEGTVSGGKVQFSQAERGVPSNYYRVVLLGTTGKTKVERP